MAPFKKFKVQRPLVLRKPFHEHIKFLIKDAAAYFGINLNGWHDFRRYYYSPWMINDHLKVERLSEAEIEYVKEVSSKTLVEYKEMLDKFTDEALTRTTQGSVLTLLEEIMRGDPIHRRIVDIGSCYSRVFRQIALKYPDFAWDMVDFPKNLEEMNQDIPPPPGMTFHSAYPLNFVESTDQSYDIVIFNRTLSWMGVDQIGAYLNALREKTRYVIFAEPCKMLFEPGSLNIDAIRLHRPRAYGDFLVHNYRAVFENFRYELIHYDADSSTQINTTPLHFMIRGVARPKS